MIDVALGTERFILLLLLIHLAAIHILVMIFYNILYNPHDPSFFTRFFPYQFLYNLYSKNSYELDKSYFIFRLDINTSQENVKRYDEGVQKLIKMADQHDIPLTISIATEYLSSISDKTKQVIKNSDNAIISHSHSHDEITKKDQEKQIKKSKTLLEKEFDRKIRGMIAPKAKHDLSTLEAAKTSSIEYFSAGAVSYIRYWSFPFPFKKKGIWLFGGGIPSDYYLYEKKDLSPRKTLEHWKEDIKHRAMNQWLITLEYHNFSASEEKLKVLNELFKFVNNHSKIEAVHLDTLVDILEE